MKKLLMLLLALVFPAHAFAWETAIGAGYDHRHFNANDQLGATAPDKKLSPTHSSGFRVGGSIIWNVYDDYRVGPEIWVSQGWLSAPRQVGYYTKTAGVIKTDDLTLQSVTIAARTQIAEWEGYKLFVKPGFLLSILTSGFSDAVDIDTGAITSIEFTGNIGRNNRFFVDMQAVFSPSTEGPGRLVVSSNLVLGIQWIFASEGHAAAPKPLEKKEDIEHAKPAELPFAATPAAEPEAPKPIEVQPVVVKINPEAQKVKGTLKLGPDGRLDPGSYPLIEKVVEAHNQKPSIIKILHKKDVTAQKLAEEIKNYVISKGCPEAEVLLEVSEELPKPIKISVVQK